MHILFISQYFPPEVNAPAARTSEHVRVWVQDRYRVTVLTAFPHHPTGIVRRGYRHRALMRERYEGAQVVRTFVYATANRGFLKRVLSYLSFMASACLLGPFCVRKPDVVVATSPQFFVAIAGWFLSKVKQVPFVFEVRDFWPASIVAVGALKEGFVLRVLEAVEMFLYRSAARVVVVTDAMKQALVQRGIAGEKVKVVKNGVDLSGPTWCVRDGNARRRLGLRGKFVVSYIGTHGMAHGLGSVLECAASLQALPKVHFLFVGEGAEKPGLLQLRDRMGLCNVTFLPQQPREMVPELLGASDLCLVPLRKAALFKTVIPSKIFEIMAASRPILLSVDGEARAVVEEAGAGVYVPPEDPEAMAEAIRELMSSPAKRDALGEAGRRYVAARMSREQLARLYETVLADVTGTAGDVPAPLLGKEATL